MSKGLKKNNNKKETYGTICKACLGNLTRFNILKWMKHQCQEYLLGVKANLCLHNSQYSFLLCFSHWTKL